MRNAGKIGTILFLTVTAVLLLGWGGNLVAGRQAKSAPFHFSVKFPELGDQTFNQPVIEIPHEKLGRLEVLVPKPFADRLGYGGLFLSINGQAANRILDKVNTPDGKLLRADLKRLPGFLLREGKNALEVVAELDDGTELYHACVVSTPYGGLPSTADSGTGPVERFQGEKYALVIGVSRYLYGSSLKFADADARAFREFLLSEQGGSFRPENITLLENETATLAGVTAALDRVASKLRADDLLVFFLAGHGGPDPDRPKLRYFMTHDTNEDFSRTALPMTFLRDRLTKDLRAKRLVCFIDTCHSAGFGGEDAGFGMRNFGLNLINQDFESLLFGSEGIAVLTSSDVNEKSYESPRWDGHGVFTYYLLRGLKGEADADGDRVVTAGEIFAFVRGRVPEAVEQYVKELKDRGVKADFTGQHPRAAVGNNDRLQIALVPTRKK